MERRWLGIAVTLLAVACHGRGADPCERAVQRLERIDAAREDRVKATPAVWLSTLEQCRRGGTAARDPVLRCALDSDSDEAAAACIDAFVKAVVPSPSDGEAGSAAARGSGAQGLNPLLDVP